MGIRQLDGTKISRRIWKASLINMERENRDAHRKDEFRYPKQCRYLEKTSFRRQKVACLLESPRG